MSLPTEDPVEGPAANEIVADDPFWSVVRRRHPDVDIVLLPPEDSSDLTPAPGDTPVHTDDKRAEFTREVTALWHLFDQGDGRPVVRWTAAPVRGAVALEGRITAEVSPDDATAALRRAIERLTTEGWHVLAAPDGTPRVAAGQARSTGRRTVQLVRLPARGQLLLIVRSEPIPVTRNTMDTLLGGAR